MRRVVGVERNDGTRERGLDIVRVRGRVYNSLPGGALFNWIVSRGFLPQDEFDGNANLVSSSKYAK